MSLDDFPIRDHNSELAEQSEATFECSVVEAGQFVVQQRDRHDYGTDFHIEATHSGGMTNFRVHAQLKGTTKTANKDGSISISVGRTNLNYMLSQPNSIYVCFHSPTRQLFVRSAEDVFRDAEHNGEEWRRQDSLTVRFLAPFDAQFQSDLRARIIAASTTHRDDRLSWLVTPPDHFPKEVAVNIPSIVVPESPEDAFVALCSLYEGGQDSVISKAFEQFSACFGPNDPKMTYAYLSEINLAMRRKGFKAERVSAAIDFIKRSRPDNSADALYNRANGHSALRQSKKAKRLYREAIRKSADNPHLMAQCWKNLGTEIELEGNHSEALRCYERAIALVPDLMEAHMALATCHRDAGNLELALHHFDHVIWASNEPAATFAARGHRIDVYFRLRMADKAFDDIAVLLPHGDREPWVFGWCARLVYNYARSDDASILRAIRFWDAFLLVRPKDRHAQKERLLCLAHAKLHGQILAISYERYVADVSAYLAGDGTDSAYLWDRVGHWAQIDGNWDQAEQQYRKAYLLEPDRYGFCLGVALNYLQRFKEALPILREQATLHHPDALSWFHLAVAQEGVGAIPDCKKSYKRALSLDPNYDLAMFNLGGIYWNQGQSRQAFVIWSDAIKKFPNHELAAKLKRDFPQLFDNASRD
jgi:tetratricopeptide (TPR) repeat protein